MNDNTAVSTSESWSSYRVPSRGCELRHPPDWARVAGTDGTLVAVRSPPREADAFRSSLSVVVQPSQDMTQEECIAAQLTALELVLDGIVVLESEGATVCGRLGARAVAAYHDDDLELTLEQWLAPVDDGALVLSATALTSDFMHDAETLRAIADSVRFDD